MVNGLGLWRKLFGERGRASFLVIHCVTTSGTTNLLLLLCVFVKMYNTRSSEISFSRDLYGCKLVEPINFSVFFILFLPFLVFGFIRCYLFSLNLFNNKLVSSSLYLAQYLFKLVLCLDNQKSSVIDWFNQWPTGKVTDSQHKISVISRVHALQYKGPMYRFFHQYPNSNLVLQRSTCKVLNILSRGSFKVIHLAFNFGCIQYFFFDLQIS